MKRWWPNRGDRIASRCRQLLCRKPVFENEAKELVVVCSLILLFGILRHELHPLR